MAGEALAAAAVETIARSGGVVAGRAGGHRPTLPRAPHDFADSPKISLFLRFTTALAVFLAIAGGLSLIIGAGPGLYLLAPVMLVLTPSGAYFAWSVMFPSRVRAG
jgi:hypothetical protein